MADKPTTPPPAYFLSLSLENVRSFGAKQTINFLNRQDQIAQWTIILGDNGVGKTTILKALSAVIAVKEKGDVPFYVSRYLVDWPYPWQLVRSEGVEPAEINYKAGVGSYLQNIHDRVEKKVFWEQKLTVQNQLGAGGAKRSGTVLFEEVAGLICYGYGAGRATGNSTLSETPEAADTCASLFDDRADLLNPEEWFLFADYRMAKDKDPLTTQNFHLIKAALLKIMEEGEVTDLDVAPVQSNSGSPRQSVRFKTPYGWVRLRDMSLGYQTLVVWLTDLADKLFVRYPNSKNPLEEPAIVLIDEIDLHLHPSWQRKLLKSLSEIFKNTQFIATAHSPLVVQAAGDVDANVVLLRREGDQTVVVTDLPDVRRWRVEQILNSELFDDTPPVSPQTEADLARRNELLLKKRLTKAEKAELEQLEQVVAAQPVGNTGPERQAEDLLARLARNLGPEGLLK
jgi:ABC-type branched-subunit amino acid transport system ATPase component